MAGVAKKEKRGLLQHAMPLEVAPAANYLPPQNVQFAVEAAPVHLVEQAPIQQHNTFSVQRISVPVPYEKTIVKTVERPVPQVS